MGHESSLGSCVPLAEVPEVICGDGRNCKSGLGVGLLCVRRTGVPNPARWSEAGVEEGHGSRPLHELMSHID